MIDNSLLTAYSDPSVRRRYTAAQKCQIVIESLQPNTSIAAVARAHGLNANQLHNWRWLYRRGDLGSVNQNTAASVSPLLPVSIIAESTTAMPLTSSAVKSLPQGSIEVLIGSTRVFLHGAVDAQTLRCLIGTLTA